MLRGPRPAIQADLTDISIVAVGNLMVLPLPPPVFPPLSSSSTHYVFSASAEHCQATKAVIIIMTNGNTVVGFDMAIFTLIAV